MRRTFRNLMILKANVQRFLKRSIFACLALLSIFVAGISQRHANEPEQPIFEIRNLQASVIGGVFHLKGTAKNTTGRDCMMAQISYNVFNEENEIIGTLTAVKQYFKAGTIWKFDALTGANPGRYEFQTADCF